MSEGKTSLTHAAVTSSPLITVQDGCAAFMLLFLLLCAMRFFSLFLSICISFVLFSSFLQCPSKVL